MKTTMIRELRQYITKITMVVLLSFNTLYADNIYHKGWIDFNKNGQMDIYENPKAEVNARIDDLLSQMTMDEKTAQMVTLYGWRRVLQDEYPTEAWKQSPWKDGIANIDEQANFSAHVEPADHAKYIETIQKWFVEETRLGIPVDFTNEGIHGLCHDYCTSFPNQTARGATFDLDLEYKIGVITGREARSLGYTNVYSPILDVIQDPRWGRCCESYGESPFLVGEMGKMNVSGLQSQNIVSTPKHFGIYSQPYGGKDNVRSNAQIPFRNVHEIQLEPFRKAFQEASALGTMGTYAAYDGESVIGSPYYMTELLRKQWGFKGYVVSDSGAVQYIYCKHQQEKDFKGAIAKAVNAGLNVRTAFQSPEVYLTPLREAISENLISEQTINSRVRDVLYVKFWLGLFNDPYTGWENAPAVVHNEEAKAIALKAARESIVLLKNQDNILPLDKEKYKRILVCGPSANSDSLMIRHYGPHHADITTPLEGIKDSFKESKTEIIFSQGCSFIDKNFPESDIDDNFTPNEEEVNKIQDAINEASKSDLIITCLGDSLETIGEIKSRSSLNLPKLQMCLLRELVKTGKPLIVVFVNGRPVSSNYAQANAKAILAAFLGGESCGTAIAECLTGDYNPGGRMPFTTPKTVGQIPMSIPTRYQSWNHEGGKAYVNGPLYYFGYGLSYTNFEYGNPDIEIKGKGENAEITVSFAVKNTGFVDGDVVPQLYISDVCASVSPFKKLLRGFDRVSLKAGQQKEVVIKLNAGRDLKMMDLNNKWIVEPGKFEIMIADSYKDSDVKHKKTIELKSDGNWIVYKDPEKGKKANTVKEINM